MSLRHIRIFLAVCSCGNNISKAAKQLLISQPSVSVAIRELEDYYGIQLFDRLSRRLYLTEAGRQFLQYAQRISSTYSDMESDLFSWNTSGKIRIGASMTIGSQFMAEYVSRYKKEAPEVQVFVRVNHSIELEKGLLKNEYDLALVETPVSNPALVKKRFMEDELAIIAPPGKNGSSQTEMTLDELLTHDFILREEGSGARNIFDETLAGFGKTAEPIWVTNSTTAIINAVSHGIGFSVLPEKMAQEAILSGKVRRVTVDGLHFRQSFYIEYHRDKLLTPPIEAFIRVVR